MGMASSGGGKSRFRGTYRPISDINVTPFIDIILVLLLVFMITAPLLTTGVKVDLPQTKAASLPMDETPILITVTQDHQIFVQEMAVGAQELIPKLEAITKHNRETTLYIRADQGISYGHVMKIMGLINGAGFSKVALVSTPFKSSEH